VLAGCSGKALNIVADPTPASAHQVVIYDYKFKPQALTVPRGTTVSWVNRDTAPHTATRRSISDEPFDSGNLTFEAGFSHTFQSTGTFHYLCIYHPGMQGTVVVE
jgi:plastocyanin